jgi:glucose-1-phosphate cytidylyltransferase
MKVVLFCGGLGTRLREHSDTIPKALVNIGFRPMIWHLMRYYSHFGHKDFILCLGYRGDLVRDYFLNYNECMSNDFVLTDGGRTATPLRRDIADWRITFVDTGLHSNIGQRLVRVRDLLAGEEAFLANYADGLSDIAMNDVIDEFMPTSAVATFASVRPAQSFHAVRSNEDGVVQEISPVSNSDVWINGGYFVLRRQIFDYIREGEELVEHPFRRLLAEGKLRTYKHRGFWQAMDTFKDKIGFDRMEAQGHCPWVVWQNSAR